MHTVTMNVFAYLFYLLTFCFLGVFACVVFILHQKIQKMAKCTFWYQLTQVVLDKVQRAVKSLYVFVFLFFFLFTSLSTSYNPE